MGGELKPALVEDMKLQLLPSTFDNGGSASLSQHLTCFVIDDSVAIDAGSLAMAATPTQQRQVRDIVLTHAHLDHIAGLPLFVDDLFPTLSSPITVHSTQAVIDTLERDVFNWCVYPRFSELANDNGPVLAYRVYSPGETFTVKHLTFRSIEVNHRVPSTGFLVSDGDATVAISGDTAEMAVVRSQVEHGARPHSLQGAAKELGFGVTVPGYVVATLVRNPPVVQAVPVERLDQGT